MCFHFVLILYQCRSRLQKFLTVITPYSLLGFFPQFQMRDLRSTSRRQAEACFGAAKKAGLKRVKLGNEPLFL